MQQARATVVRGKDGGRGTMVPASQHAPSDVAQVLVQLESGAQVLVPAGALIRQQDGSDYVPLNLAELVPTRIGHCSENDPVLRVPVIAEELEVQKRVVETGTVRITKVVHEHETVIDEPLVAAEVEVERVPIQRVVEGPIPVRYEGDTVVVSLLEEVLVEKAAHAERGAAYPQAPRRGVPAPTGDTAPRGGAHRASE